MSNLIIYFAVYAILISLGGKCATYFIHTPGAFLY